MFTTPSIGSLPFLPSRWMNSHLLSLICILLISVLRFRRFPLCRYPRCRYWNPGTFCSHCICSGFSASVTCIPPSGSMTPGLSRMLLSGYEFHLSSCRSDCHLCCGSAWEPVPRPHWQVFLTDATAYIYETIIKPSYNGPLSRLW